MSIRITSINCLRNLPPEQPVGIKNRSFWRKLRKIISTKCCKKVNSNLQRGKDPVRAKKSLLLPRKKLNLMLKSKKVKKKMAILTKNRKKRRMVWNIKMMKILRTKMSQKHWKKIISKAKKISRMLNLMILKIKTENHNSDYL